MSNESAGNMIDCTDSISRKASVCQAIDVPGSDYATESKKVKGTCRHLKIQRLNNEPR